MTRNFARLLCVTALVAGLVSPAANALTNLATGLTAGVGVAADPSGNAVYYVDWNAGTLRKIRFMPPGCTAATPCPISTVAAGFSHPQDVALDMAHNHAYVSTRDDPGTTGSLWRVDLGTGTKTLITFNLGAPHQIVLDMATNTAYVVGFDIGRLWKINLATGSKATVGIGLDHPIGLALTADRTRAYITEQPAGGGRLAEYDVATHVRIRNVVTGLTAPFYVKWTDPAQIALYLVQRSPVNNVLRVDLTAATSVPVIVGLPLGASGIALDAFGSVAYVTADQFVVRADLATLDMGEPVFVAVGHVPSTKIVDGYATTNPGYFYQVKDSPFGGTLNIFGNFNIWKGLGATHYRVKVSKDGAMPPSVLALSWNAYLWNTVSNQYELTAVGPVPGTANRYAIPAEYPLLATRWVPPFLMMQWPSGANGMYTFSVEIWQLAGGAWIDKTGFLPAGKNKLTVKIDNDPPIVDLTKIRLHTTGTELDTCAIVGPPAFPAFPPAPVLDVKLTANDPNGHLLDYWVTAYFGHTSPPATVVPVDSYASHVNADGLHLWKGPAPNLIAPPAGWTPTCNCAYTFFLDVRKRTTDGYQYLLHGQSHQSITIMNAAAAGTTCP